MAERYDLFFLRTGCQPDDMQSNMYGTAYNSTIGMLELNFVEMLRPEGALAPMSDHIKG